MDTANTPKKTPKRIFSDGKRVCAAEAEGMVCASRQTITRWYGSGKFPDPHFIGQRRYWFRSEIERWLEEQTSAA
ncbi:MAG: helix-turn-helix domain-containing protein [Candidatus Sedimenticola sp. (ex Thyasira tokunagai)]